METMSLLPLLLFCFKPQLKNWIKHENKIMYAIKLNDAFVDSNMNTWYEIKHGALCPEMSTQNKEKNRYLKSKSFQISFARISVHTFQKCLCIKIFGKKHAFRQSVQSTKMNTKPNQDVVAPITNLILIQLDYTSRKCNFQRT